MQATAWILDVGHRAQRLDFEVPPGTRAAAAARDAITARLGLSLGDPLGLRDLDSAPVLLYLHPTAGDGAGWVPLRTWASDDLAFALYTEAMLGGWRPPTRTLDVFFFGDGPAIAAKLAHMVVKGRKRGTTCWIDAAEREGSTIPSPGLVSIVTDGFGYPACAIQSAQVDRVPFRDITAEQASIEGEGDGSLEDWIEGHRRFFEEEGRPLGLAFTDDSIVCFEHFRVLAVFGRADG